ncbi:OLC1v1016756C1 [Oldenlandia corymbosa var. corymbosa]|uniref:OLC1v1016756C1 n=1 Tax=Oldenlandia corymbosa var. corymbosa TaxID=529605 RepID=A0AAV1E7W0_OLDCO|nr:OLC1v1016756C1 [Oldenlandia corymbosa var. corymbosa]
MASSSEIERDAPPYIRSYKDGTIERLVGFAVAPAGLDPQTGVTSKDVVAIPETGVIVRLYRPSNLETGTEKLPLVVYFHGGAFCISSAFDPFYHGSLNRLAAEAKAIVAGVNFRNAPEHPLPTAYEDSWDVLQWVGSHSSGTGSEDWLNENVDFSKVFLSGDSAGANISHHLAIRAGKSDPKFGLGFKGIVMIHPYFWGKEPIGVEITDPVRKSMVDNWWLFVCPSDKGCDDPLINPFLYGIEEELPWLACGRILIFVAGNDILVERGRKYSEYLVQSRWQGKAEIVETPGEDHDFHIFAPDTDNARGLIKKWASFVNEV